jgi:hypothetical protein
MPTASRDLRHGYRYCRGACTGSLWFLTPPSSSIFNSRRALWSIDGRRHISSQVKTKFCNPFSSTSIMRISGREKVDVIQKKGRSAARTISKLTVPCQLWPGETCLFWLGQFRTWARVLPNVDDVIDPPRQPVVAVLVSSATIACEIITLHMRRQGHIPQHSRRAPKKAANLALHVRALR